MSVDVELVDLRLAVDNNMRQDDNPINVKCPDSVHRARLGGIDLNASLAVYQHNLHCWGCGFHTVRRRKWSSLALLLGLWDGTGDDYPSAMLSRQRGHEFLRSTFVSKQESRPVLPLSPGRAIGMHKFLMNHRPEKVEQEFIIKRGLTIEQVKEARLGHDGARYSIPVYDKDGELVTIRYRRDDSFGTRRPDSDKEYPKYEGTYGRNKPCLYPEHRVRRYIVGNTEHSKPYIYITESELDTLFFWQRGYAACSITNGSGQCHLTPKLLYDRLGVRPASYELYIATDQDGAGNKAGREIAIAAEQLGFTTRRVSWPAHIKDVGELGAYCRRLGIADAMDLIHIEEEHPHA